MPTPVAHALTGWCLAAAPRADLARSPRALLTVVAAANLPDLDYLALLRGHAAMEASHQHFTHSLLFVLAGALLLAPLLRPYLRPWQAVGLLALAGLSHLGLDLVSYDAKPPIGIPLLWPLTDARWHAPWTLFPGIDRSSLGAVLGRRNLTELAVELAVMAPAVLLVLRLRAARRGTR